MAIQYNFFLNTTNKNNISFMIASNWQWPKQQENCLSRAILLSTHSSYQLLFLFLQASRLSSYQRELNEKPACQKISVGCVCPAHGPFWISPIEQQKNKALNHPPVCLHSRLEKNSRRILWAALLSLGGEASSLTHGDASLLSSD